MKIAVALRTCGSVFNKWNFDRIVEADKPTILLTCLNSLLNAMTHSKHEFILSIHDDNSSEQTLNHIDILCKKYNIEYELFKTEEGKNFVSQYEWTKKQNTDFCYCVEDDYLHHENIFDEMIDMYDYLKAFVKQPAIDYAVYPWNSPDRYNKFDKMYPVMVFKHKDKYWRSDLQSAHTFFITKQTFDLYEDIMRFQAYHWPKYEAWDNHTICKIWQEQITRLVVPLESLAFHLSDTVIPEIEYKSLWEKHYYEI